MMKIIVYQVDIIQGKVQLPVINLNYKIQSI